MSVSARDRERDRERAKVQEVERDRERQRKTERDRRASPSVQWLTLLCCRERKVRNSEREAAVPERAHTESLLPDPSGCCLGNGAHHLLPAQCLSPDDVCV